jgi:lipoprotein Spr
MRRNRLPLLIACIAAWILASCEIQKSSNTYSYKRHNPKFINGVAVGGHNSSGIKLDDVVDQNDEDDANSTDDATPIDIGYNTSAPPKKSTIKVQTEEVEPKGLQQPKNIVTDNKNHTITYTITAVGKAVTKNMSQTFTTLQHKYAEMLGVVPQAITNMALYSFIDDWYGTRYHLGGTGRNGIDCSAFVQRLYDQVFCTSLLRTAIEQFSTSAFTRKATNLKEGDLVFFHIHSRHITHVGIYLANNFFVHASRSQGVTISNLNDGYWRKYYAGAGKVQKDDKYTAN